MRMIKMCNMRGNKRYKRDTLGRKKSKLKEKRLQTLRTYIYIYIYINIFVMFLLMEACKNAFLDISTAWIWNISF